MLLKWFLGLKNPVRMLILIRLYGVLYALTHILGLYPQNLIGHPKVFSLNSYLREKTWLIFPENCQKEPGELNVYCQLQR